MLPRWCTIPKRFACERETPVVPLVLGRDGGREVIGPSTGKHALARDLTFDFDQQPFSWESAERLKIVRW